MKLYVSALLVGIFLLCLPLTANAATVTIEIPSIIASVGQKDIVVPVQVSDLTGLGALAIELVIGYDTQMLTATAVDVTNTLSQDALMVRNIQTDVGKISIAITLTSLFKGSGDLLRLLFDALPGIQGTSLIQFLSVNINEGEGFIVNTSDGSIIIQGGPPAPAPSISEVTPFTGPTTGGTPITVRGADFQSDATVQVGGNLATEVTFINATTLTAIAPAGSPGAADVVVTNPNDQSTTRTAGFTYISPDLPFTVEAGLDQTADEGQPVTFEGSFIAPDPNGNYTLRWDFGDESVLEGTLNPTHTYLDDGDYTVTLSVTDDSGNIGTDTLQVMVNNVAPKIQRTGELTGIEGSTIPFRATASDPGVLDMLSISWDFGDGSTAADSLTPQHTYVNDGDYTVQLTVSDDDRGVGTASFTVRVANALPEVSAGEDKEADIGQPILFEGDFSDAGSEDTHAIEWDFGDRTSASNDLTPQHAYAEAGVYTVRLTVTDDAGGQGTDTLTVRVSAADAPPSVIAEDSYFGVENSPIQFTLRVEDDDPAELSYEVQGLPFADGNEDPGDDATITDLNEEVGFSFEWTPPLSTVSKATGVQSFYLAVVAEDSGGHTVSKLIEVVVRHVDVAPTLSVPEQIQAEPGEIVRFSLQASDDGDTFHFSHSPAEIGQLDIDPDVSSQVTFTWDTTGAPPTVYLIQFQVTDSDGLMTSAETQIRLVQGNHPPQLVNAPEGDPWIRDYRVDEGASLTIENIHAEDPDPGDMLTWQVEGTPAWLDVSQIDAGKIVGNPGYTDAGEYRFLLTVTDSGSLPLSASQEILIVVSDVNRPPVLTVEGERQLTSAGQLDIRLVAQDPDPDNAGFTYAITPLAFWMVFNAEQGILTNQTLPLEGAYPLTASVTDSAGGTTTQEFVITVEAETPEPSKRPQIETIQITPTTPMTVGGKAAVTVTGRAGQTGSFTIPGVPNATDLALTETSDGMYEGVYEVRPGDQAIGAAVTVTLVDSDGNEVTQTSTERLHIDTEAMLLDAEITPPTLSNSHAYTLTVRSEDGATVTADLSQVDAFQVGPISLQPDSVVPPGTETSFRITAVMNPGNTVANGSYPISLRAVDAAGNEATTLLIVQVFNEPKPAEDTTPPSPVQLSVSEMVLSASDRSLRWAASEDAESGIIGYEYVLDHTPDQQIDGVWLPTGSLDAVLELPPLLDGTYEIWIRARNGSGLASVPARVTVSVDQTPPFPASQFRAESLPGAMVRLNWIASPSSDVATYHIYTTGSTGLLDYAKPIASVLHPQTSWQSEQLPEHVPHTFALRVVDAAGNEERNLTLCVDDVVVVQNEPPKVLALTLPVNATGGDIQFGYTLEDREGDLLSIDAEYSTDNGTTWHTATVSGLTHLIASHEYQGSLTWRSVKDLAGARDVQVLLRLIPRDRFPGQPVISTPIRVTNLLADADGDQRIGLADLEQFVLVLRSGDLTYDIGPATGQPPDLRPLRDGKVDFEDLAVFVLMWNWSYRQGQPGAAPLDPITYILLHDPGLAAALGLIARPTQTRLLPNYPNPFNPETWIPYELAQDTEVHVRLFDMRGRLVRQFELGTRPAGTYLEPGRALHWDGRDRRGEPVASGVYAVTFRAGGFSATRRLTIVK